MKALHFFFKLIVVIAALELLLRFLGMPEGRFAFIVASRSGTYPALKSMSVSFGSLHYQINTDEDGFRETGKLPLSCELPRHVIAAVGDSATDGFFVSDGETYPAKLQQALNQSPGACAKVMNTGHGRASIGEEYSTIKRIMPKFHPQIVILLFNTNDIGEMGAASAEQILDLPSEPSMFSRISAIWFTESAIGEAIAETLLFFRTAQERCSVGNCVPIEKVEQGEISELISRFQKNTTQTDQLVTREPFTESTLMRISTYAKVLQSINRYLEASNSKLMFVFGPGFDQLYDSSASLRIRDILENICKTESIKFVDLTPALKEASKIRTVNLIPVDFHLNSYGNEVVAHAISEALKSELKL